MHILLSQPKRFTETVGLIPEEMPPSRHIDPTFENVDELRVAVVEVPPSGPIARAVARSRRWQRASRAAIGNDADLQHKQ